MDDEIKQEYEFTKTQQTIGAMVSQIVFPFNETNESQIRQKADEVVKKARGDDQTPAEDFAKLGGKSIGYIKKDSKDTSYKQRVFTLVDTKKDVTEPVKEGNAFYVLKVTRWDRKSLAQARPELLKQIRDRKAWTNRLTLGQVKVADDSNEITAVPELLRLLELKGCLVTVGAMNCQKEIAVPIRAQEADYVMALKANHGTWPAEVQEFFASVRDHRTPGFTLSQHQTIGGEHRRIEQRTSWHTEAPDWLTGYDQGSNLRGIGTVEAGRDIGTKVILEHRYYLSNSPVDAVRLSEAVRGHGGLKIPVTGFWIWSLGKMTAGRHRACPREPGLDSAPGSQSVGSRDNGQMRHQNRTPQSGLG